MDPKLAKAVTRVRKNPYKLTKAQSAESLTLEKQASTNSVYHNNGSPILGANTHIKVNL